MVCDIRYLWCVAMVAIMNLPVHGGDLVWAANTFQRPVEEWLDLSTAISPWVYPVPSTIPQQVWQRLPYDNHALIKAAAYYYGCEYGAINTSIIPVNGSQQAIQTIPHLLLPSSVAIPAIAYKEHALAWEKAGHTVQLYHDMAQLQQLVIEKTVKHVVVVNPNNPTGEQWSKQAVVSLQQQLSADGYCVIDEAFMDVNNEHSVSACDFLDNTIVLRSVGKFFGLAGVRLGFAIVHGEYAKQKNIIEALHAINQPWGINHLALWLGEIALLDTQWQAQQRQRIDAQQKKLQDCLVALSLGKYAGRGLLNTLFGDANALYKVFVAAAQQGILLRYELIDEHNAWLRIGLPTDEQFSRLQTFLHYYMSE